MHNGSIKNQVSEGLGAGRSNMFSLGAGNPGFIYNYICMCIYICISIYIDIRIYISICICTYIYAYRKSILPSAMLGISGS